VTEKVSLGGALKAAYGFWWPGVRATAGILAMATIALAWLGFVTGQTEVNSAAVDSSIAYVALTTALILVTLAWSAVYRAAFGRVHPKEPDFVTGPLGFQVGRPEATAFVASVLVGVLQAMLAFMLVLGLLAAMVGVGAPGHEPPKTLQDAMALMGPMWPPSPRWRTVYVYVAGALLLWSWINTRLSLSIPASVAERRVRVLSSWGLTKGRFWMMLAGGIVIMAPVVALSYLQSRWLEPLVAALHWQAFSTDLQAVNLLISAALVTFYQLPVMGGFNAYIYERVGPTSPPEPKAP
jgi:hypothetical protein